MFREDYKAAYDGVKVKEQLKRQMMSESETKNKLKRTRPFAAAITMAAMVMICVFVVIPVGAAGIPAFYRIVESISPSLADTLVPIEEECTDNGIVMRVEAVSIEGKHGEIVVSFRDEEGYDRIRGKVDLYDRYRLVSRDGKSNMGGCSFLTYDEEEQKAYYKIDVWADEEFDKAKMTFYCDEILCEVTRTEQEIDLSVMRTDFSTKEVAINGGSWGADTNDVRDAFDDTVSGEKAGDDPRPVYKVLDVESTENYKRDELTITGIAYKNNLLRVQVCRGDLSHADRHVSCKLLDADGNEVPGMGSVGWSEEIDGVRYFLDEVWFPVQPETLEGCRLTGTFFTSGESVEGDWKVTFRME